MRNPFKPTAGASPPLLVGREEALGEFVESIHDGPGAPGRLTIFTGPRGVGKTVMLNEVRTQTEQLGWITLAETATTGMGERLTWSARRHASELDDGRRGRRITGVTLPVVGGGIELAEGSERPPDLREELTALLELLEPHQTGVLITVDEIHRKRLDELRHLATTIQHLISEDREIALAVAGLPSAVSDLLNDEILTFLRRAAREELSDVPLEQVRDAFAKTITESGRTITDTALDATADATSGYPFMIQLVGYHTWRKAIGDVIDDQATTLGIPATRKRLGSTVHAAALADLSPVDRTFLLAMSQDDGPSRVRDISPRMTAADRTPQPGISSRDGASCRTRSRSSRSSLLICVVSSWQRPRSCRAIRATTPSNRSSSTRTERTTFCRRRPRLGIRRPGSSSWRCQRTCCAIRER
ncbi:ATP-binding protein [Georgenia halophila]|uniref:ATP-binding protein n=1 Tax=Georgenia halophila TaxID=620889 RepID=A0ABP8LG99_9MICO